MGANPNISGGSNVCEDIVRGACSDESIGSQQIREEGELWGARDRLMAAALVRS